MKKRIAIIGNSSETLIKFRTELILDLLECGYEVYTMVPNITKDKNDRIEKIGAIPIEIRMDRRNLNIVNELISIADIVKKLKENNIDFIFSYFMKPVIYSSIGARITKTTSCYGLIAGLGYTFTYTEKKKDKLKKYIYKKIIISIIKKNINVYKKIFFQNPDDLNLFVTSSLIKMNKCVLVNGSGINLSEYTLEPVPTENVITFLTMGRLLIEKGFLDYFQAANLIRNKYQNIRFILLGGYDENPSSIPKAAIDDIRSKRIVEWYDHVEDVRSWLRKSSVFVLPSYREGTPRSTLEALATGRAVITTDVPGCRETVIEGVNGFFVPPRDPEKLAEVMERFILNPELIRSMGVESRRLAEEKFDVRKVNKKMMEEMGLLADKSMIST